MTSPTSPLPKTDPAYGDMLYVLARYGGQRIAAGPEAESLLHDLLEVVATDRWRRELDALNTAILPPDQRLALGADPDDDESITVWVASGVTPMGVYTCEISYGEDRSRILVPSEVIPYTTALLTALAYAEYDAAVYNQLRNRPDISPDVAAQAPIDLRKSRPNINQQAVHPLIVRASFGINSGLPYLSVRLAGTRQRGRWDPADVIAHVHQVWETSVVADLDGGYRRYLVGTVGLDDSTARDTVSDLRRWRHPRGAA